MRYLISMLICGWLAGTCLAEESAPAKPTPEVIRESVSRSLPFLESEGVAWMEGRLCMSCHHVPFTVWTHHAAQAKGIAIDTQKLAQWDEWVRQDSLSQRHSFRLGQYEVNQVNEPQLPLAIKEKLKPVINQKFFTEAELVEKLAPLLSADELTAHQPVIVQTATLQSNHPFRSGGGLDALAPVLLLPRETLGSSTAEQTSNLEFRAGVIGLMRQLQLEDGSWMPGSQFQSMRKWTLPTANRATTMWIAMAMGQYRLSEEPPSDTVAKAIAFERQQAPPDNHEWLATRMLFEKEFGSSDDVERLREQLIAERNADGGWGWTKDAVSDPYTTGLVLYAVAKVGAGNHQEAIDGAAAYLVASQQPDGSWKTDSRTITNASGEERIAARNEIYHYWGTGWAALGLLETLPQKP
jgi:hypothetical protein